MKIVPVYDAVLLPGVQYHLNLENLTEDGIEELESVTDGVVLAYTKEKPEDVRGTEDFHEIGVAGRICSVQRAEAGVWVSVDVVGRVRSTELRIGPDMLEGDFEPVEDIDDLNEEAKQELVDFLKKNARETAEHFNGTEKMMEYMDTLRTPNELICFLSQFIGMTPEEKYSLLETSSLKERGSLFCDYLLKFKNSIELREELARKYKETQGKSYKENMLRQQIDLLQSELGEMDPEETSEVQKFRESIEQAPMPEETRAELLRVLKRLEKENPHSTEYSTLESYIEYAVSLPWGRYDEAPVNLKEARRILDRDHYGLEKVKERIMQHLAVMALKGDASGSIFLLVGAPGTGKTSIGRSIAEALGRKYARVSLGGVRDEAEIRGHRRTYVGAMPGRILEGIRRSGSANPVMVLDEVDKLAASYNGDPSSALLEVLDPEQNQTFTDHYLDVPFDLSRTVFLCTANTTDSIPQPLLDRMEVIDLAGYTPIEKQHIGQDYLLPAALRDSGLPEGALQVPEDVMKRIISDYTMEAGVRGLRKQLDVLCRKAAVRIVEDGQSEWIVTEEELPEVLGRRVNSHDSAEEDNLPGVATGLAWTQVGGEILFIEAIAMEGTGQIRLTGQLGDVMKESAEISLSLVRSRFADSYFDFAHRDIHIHVPTGAVPKDGPSAGITLYTALVSMVTGRTVDPHLAMTGEISLRGRVLPIGGLPEKLMAAQRAGIRRILIPQKNMEDLREVAPEVRAELEVIPVSTVDEVLSYAFGEEETPLADAV